MEFRTVVCSVEGATPSVPRAEAYRIPGALRQGPQVGPHEVARIGTVGAPSQCEHGHDVQSPGGDAVRRSGRLTRTEPPAFALVTHHDADRAATVSEQHLPQCVPHGSNALAQSIRHKSRVDAHRTSDQLRHAPPVQRLIDLSARTDHGYGGNAGGLPNRSGSSDLTLMGDERAIHGDSSAARPPVRGEARTGHLQEKAWRRAEQCGPTPIRRGGFVGGAVRGGGGPWTARLPVGSRPPSGGCPPRSPLVT